MILLPTFGLVAQEPSSVNYSIEQGLLSSEVYYLLEDRTGYLWIATDKGVNRFDGRQMESYTVSDGLADKDILSMYQDRSGRIWFLSYNGKLSFWKDGQFYNEENCDLLKNSGQKSMFLSFLQDDEGRIWFGTHENGLLILNPYDQCKGEVIYSSDPKTGIEKKVHYLFEKSNGTIFFIGNRGLYRFEKDTSQLIYPIVDYDVGISHYYNSDKELLYLSAENKLFCYSFEAEKVIWRQTFHSAKVINRVRMMNGGEIWIATDDGVFALNEEGAVLNQLLKDRKASDILLDQEDNLWVSTLYNGVYLIKNSVVLHYETKAKYVVLEKENAMLFGGAEMELHEIRDNQLIKKPLHFQGNTSLSSQDRIQVLAVDATNQLWLGTNRGLFRLEEMKAHLQYYSVINAIHFDQKDIYLASRGGISRIDINDLEQFNLAYQKDLPVSRNPINRYIIEKHVFNKEKIFCFHRKQKGQELLIGTTDGIQRIDGNHVQTWKEGCDFPEGKMLSIIENHKGALLVLYAKKGLFYYDIARNNLTEIKVAHDLKNLTYTAMQLDEDQSVWLTSNQGLFHVTLQKEQLVTEHFHTAHGLNTNDINDLALTDSVLWLATAKGITSFPKDWTKKELRLQFFIDSISTNGHLLSSHLPLSLPYNSNDISISYHGISFKHEGELSFAYHLKGEYSKKGISKKRQLVFNDLPTSNYELVIYAFDEDGNKSLPQKINFDINVPWWKQWWALFTFFTLVLTIAYQSIRWKGGGDSKAITQGLALTNAPSFKPKQFIIVKSVLDGSNVKVPLGEILFVEASGDYMEIHLPSKKILVRSTMKALEEKFGLAPSLIRVHKSYIANLEHANTIKRSELTIGNTTLPISRTYSNAVKAYLKGIED